jgi:hypothetical protein
MYVFGLLMIDFVRKSFVDLLFVSVYCPQSRGDPDET